MYMYIPSLVHAFSGKSLVLYMYNYMYIHVHVYMYIHVSLHLTVFKYIMYSQQESLCELESEVEKREEEVIQLKQQLACMTTPTSTSMDLLQAKVGLIMMYLLCIQICQLWDKKLMYMQQIAS